MPLVECPECKREISDRAASCPHCGCPVSRQPKAGERGQETVLWSRHPVIFVGEPAETIFWLLITIPFSVLLGYAFGLGVILVYVVLVALRQVRDSYSSKFTVTDQRTIVRHGILLRSTVAISHADAETVQVEGGILQRLFETGDVTIRASGAPGMEIKIRGIEHPDKVAALIRARQSE